MPGGQNKAGFGGLEFLKSVLGLGYLNDSYGITPDLLKASAQAYHHAFLTLAKECKN